MNRTSLPHAPPTGPARECDIRWHRWAVAIGGSVSLGLAANAWSTALDRGVGADRGTSVAVPPRLLTDPSIIFARTGGKESRSPLRGSVQVLLLIDRQGMPRQCAVLKSKGDGELAGLTCRSLMAKARFEPARDRTGRTIAAVYSLPLVRWN